MNINWDLDVGWVMHGDELLIEQLPNFKFTPWSLFIEIGSGMSSIPLALQAKKMGLVFKSVDLSSEYNSLDNILKKIDPHFDFLKMRGEEFLKGISNSISVVYLDAYDTMPSGYVLPLDMQMRYSEVGGWGGSEAAWLVHLEFVKLIDKWLVPGGLICFDDCWLNEDGWSFRSKGRTAIPFLLSLGYKVVKYVHGCVLLRR
jgi:hypothetical protein